MFVLINNMTSTPRPAARATGGAGVIALLEIASPRWNVKTQVTRKVLGKHLRVDGCKDMAHGTAIVELAFCRPRVRAEAVVNSASRRSRQGQVRVSVGDRRERDPAGDHDEGAAIMYKLILA